MSSRHSVILIMYDIPSVSAKEKKAGTEFRKILIRYGFQMVQKSVYVKLIRNVNSIRSEINRISEIIPMQGDVKILPMSLGEFQRLTTLSGTEFNMCIFADDMVVI